MSLLPFDESPDVPPQAARLAPKLRELAEKGVYFGTSSWKYPGWVGSIYTDSRYHTRKKFSKAKFDDTCLAEYALTFPTVCGDFAFYRFPSTDDWKKLFEGTPDSLSFAFKVPDEITVAKWPKQPRYGKRAGLDNDGFLDAEAFKTYFADRLKPYEQRVAPLIFEFGTFNKTTFPKPEDFYTRLDTFLGSLPTGFRYSVEIRNPEYVTPSYFAMLESHNVAHVFNAWTRMPELARQIELPGVYTADFAVVRALLSYGRNYDQAVSTFEPYEKIQEPNVEARDALQRIAAHALGRKKPAFLYINNRLEGNAPGTIEAVIEGL